jgi:hypothetical protein
MAVESDASRAKLLEFVNGIIHTQHHWRLKVPISYDTPYVYSDKGSRDNTFIKMI